MHRSETAAFLNQKGGVGKTTSVANIGAGLAILGKRVLLVDLDPQGHLTSFLGIEPDDIGRTVHDVLQDDIHLRASIVTKALDARFCIDGRETRLSLSLIPSSPDLMATGTAPAGGDDNAYVLKNAIARVRDAFDYILFDCPPSLGPISVGALVASHKVFVPVQTEYLALESLEGLLRKIKSVIAGMNLDLVMGGLIATRFDGRKVLNRTVLETLRERYGVLLMETVVRENVALADSPRFGKDIFSYNPRSYGAEDYLNLSLEIMGRIASADQLFSVERGVITSTAGDTIAV